MKYVILADSDNTHPFIIPRQLTKINGEPLVKRTIRLLKENNIKDILITSHDKRFDNLGATRYEPLYNDYKPKENKGYWISAFPIELLNEPICFLMGDVYYSEKAIKTIIETDTKTTMFFCAYNNHDKKYIKHHDEPLGYKVVDYELFKKHIQIIKDFKDSGKAFREPIVWELYRSINNQDIKKHVMTTNYTAINDESCDIDTNNDIMKLQNILGGKFMVKLETTYDFTLERFNELKNIKRKNADKSKDGWLYIGDTFECNNELAGYLMGDNKNKIIVAKVIEVKDEPKQETKPKRTKKSKK